MVFINFPRVDLDNNADLVGWRAKANYAENDWKILKEFLTEQCRFLPGIHPIHKCWYTELPQGDNYALDVEHFRPKRSARPLDAKLVNRIEKEVGYKFYQNVTSTPYPWLEFNYRNYRITTALPNRGGAKHDFFPVAHNSSRLSTPQEPWTIKEYNLLLDPVDRHDADLLVVLPNGTILPRAPKTDLSKPEFDNYLANWQSDGFNYLRAILTIIVYRLDDRILVNGRKEVFTDTTESITLLLELLSVTEVSSAITNAYIEQLIRKVLPSAPFSLAARSALASYVVPQAKEAILKPIYQILSSTINTRLQQETLSKVIDWNRP